MDEEWRDAPGFPLYEISSRGRIRRKPKILKPGVIPSGHFTVALSTGRGTRAKSIYVHRLVAEAFLPKDEARKWVNHKNGVPSDNRVENLEWCTPGENIAHGYRHNGRRNPCEIRVAAVCPETGEIVFQFDSVARASRHFDVTPSSIHSAVKRNGTSCRYRWVYVGE